MMRLVFVIAEKHQSNFAGYPCNNKPRTGPRLLLFILFMVIIPAITRYLGAACVSLALFSTASAATYYIDFADGSDGNSGTSKSSPWQRCPGMNGFNHSYIHTPGDRFIFKGGVTWTGVFTWPMNNGGT